MLIEFVYLPKFIQIPRFFCSIIPFTVLFHIDIDTITISIIWFLVIHMNFLSLIVKKLRELETIKFTVLKRTMTLEDVSTSDVWPHKMLTLCQNKQ